MALGNNIKWKALPGRFQQTDESGNLMTYKTAKGSDRPKWAVDAEHVTKPTKQEVLREYLDQWKTHKASTDSNIESPFNMRSLVMHFGNHYSVSAIKGIVKSAMAKIGVEVNEFLPTNPGGKRGLTQNDVLTIITKTEADKLFS
jgi:hypothetical protein